MELAFRDSAFWCKLKMQRFRGIGREKVWLFIKDTSPRWHNAGISAINTHHSLRYKEHRQMHALSIDKVKTACSIKHHIAPASMETQNCFSYISRNLSLDAEQWSNRQPLHVTTT